MCKIDIIRIIVMGIYLFVASIIDIRNKIISSYYLMLGGGVMLLLYMAEPFNGISLTMGIAVGIFLIVVAIGSKGRIGIADGVILIVLSFGLGWSVIYILLYSLLGASIFSMILLRFKKKTKKFEIPFVPFYLIAFMLQVAYEIKRI